MAEISKIQPFGSSTQYDIRDTSKLPLSGGILTGGIEIKGHIAGDSGTSGHGLYSGGAYHNAYNNIILHGDNSTGSSGIAFVSDKVAADGTVTNINQPSDRAFIQYHAYGITTYTTEGTAPTLATSGEANKLIIGVGNDANDEIRLQTPSRIGLLHQVGTTAYTIPDTGNITGTVGSTNQPVYVNAGAITAISTLAMANGGTGNAYGLLPNNKGVSNVSIGVGTWQPKSSTNYKYIWQQKWTTSDFTYTSGDSQITNTDTADIGIWLSGSETSNNLTANMNIDGKIYAMGGFEGNLSGNATSASKLGTSNVGSTRQAIYLNGGTATAGNYTVAHLGNAGKSNMNDIGRLHSSAGMTNLTSTSNADTPRNGDTYSSSWHLYWDTNYTDNPNGSNAWVAQIVNKAGTDNWWVRSRSGGTITNGTAWTSTWRHLVTSSEAVVGSSTQPVYINASGEATACTSYANASVNYATSAGSCTGNAATATKLSNTPNNTTTFLRGDNTWSNTLTDNFNALKMGITNTDSTKGYGLSLYNGAVNGAPTYGIMFAGTGTFGTHGAVTSDWATYLTMSDTTNRGWIFRRGSTNVASIDGTGKLYLGTSTSTSEPGLYWNPYVESASDGSDVSKIYQIKSGVAGGTELRISQANDSGDVINICSPYYIYLNSKRAFQINDNWLRINENSGFSSGVYFGSGTGGVVRTDNQFQVGDQGAKFYANSSGNGLFSNNLTVGSSSAGALGIAQTGGTGLGISLYGGPKAANALEYGLHFSLTSNHGKYGDVQGDWATYFTMNGAVQRGWIFKKYSSTASTDMAAAISHRGVATFKGLTADTQYIVYPQGGTYATSTATITGALKITLPQFKTNTMITFDVTIYTYEGTNKNTVVYHIGGYEYGDSGWYNNSSRVYSEGIGNRINLPVRFAYDGSKACIIIGEVNTTWNYPQVMVSNILCGYSNYSVDKWGYGWAVSFITELPSSISGTFTNVNTQDINITGNAATATKLATGRTFQIKDNDATNSGPVSSAFDGSANLVINLPSTIKASLSGNAATATKATQDGSGNTITSTYVKKSGDTMTGQLYINYEQDVGLDQNGSLVIGNKAGENIGIDGNEIMARNNGAASTLYLNSEGGGMIYTTGNIRTNCVRGGSGIAGSHDAAFEVRAAKSGSSGSWLQGWFSGYTQNGSWSLGNLCSENLIFTYGTHANYNSNTNNVVYIQFGSGGQVYGAVWNDYAEYRITDNDIEPGRCIREIGEDKLELTTERLQRGCEIVSDTFGFAIGESKQAKTPTAVSGRVLAYPYEDREIFKTHLGWPVCSGPNGTVSLMTEEEEEKYPSRIIGTVSSVPDYEEWEVGGGKGATPPVKVNGRIWIRIR